jgi:hypothetical protein
MIDGNGTDERRPVPARITEALDLRKMDGPEVDLACGAQEPDVDDWEAARKVPSHEQIILLAELTRFPVSFFYRPVSDAERARRRVFLCDRTKRKHGLTVVVTWIDECDVLHQEIECGKG